MRLVRMLVPLAFLGWMGAAPLIFPAPSEQEPVTGFPGTWRLILAGSSVGHRSILYRAVPEEAAYEIEIGDPKRDLERILQHEWLPAGCGIPSGPGWVSASAGIHLTQPPSIGPQWALLRFEAGPSRGERFRGAATWRLLNANTLELRVEVTRLRFNEAAGGYVRAGDYHIARRYTRVAAPFIPRNLMVFLKSQPRARTFSRGSSCGRPR